MICSHCGSEYRWVSTPEGMRPLNRSDDQPHWLACKGFRKKAKNKRKHGAPVLEIRGRTITGSEHRPSCGCDTPPWEDCACSDLPNGLADKINAEADARWELFLDLVAQP